MDTPHASTEAKLCWSEPADGFIALHDQLKLSGIGAWHVEGVDCLCSSVQVSIADVNNPVDPASSYDSCTSTSVEGSEKLSE
jgi:hypothetical protein